MHRTDKCTRIHGLRVSSGQYAHAMHCTMHMHIACIIIYYSTMYGGCTGAHRGIRWKKAKRLQRSQWYNIIYRYDIVVLCAFGSYAPPNNMTDFPCRVCCVHCSACIRDKRYNIVVETGFCILNNIILYYITFQRIVRATTVRSTNKMNIPAT